MSNIFIINAGLKTHVFNPEGKAGSLNKALVDIAEKVLTECGHQVCITDLNNEWVLERIKHNQNFSLTQEEIKQILSDR